MSSPVTKSEFAALLGVALSTVSTWIARDQLTAPALLSDGRIDLDLGKAQLAETIDIAKSRGRAPEGLFGPGHAEKSTPVDHAAAASPDEATSISAVMRGYANRLAQARGDLLQIELDRKKHAAAIRAGEAIATTTFSQWLREDLQQLIAEIGQAVEDRWLTAVFDAGSDEEATLALRAEFAVLRARNEDHLARSTW